MRKFVLLTIALLLWTAGPAVAAPLTWTADPGGAFTASGGPVVFTMGSTQMSCASLVLHGVAPVGPSGNPVAVFPKSPGAEFSGCAVPFGLTVTFTQIGDWEMDAASYDPVADTVTGTIDDVAVAMEFPGCSATFGGALDFSYDNTSGRLDILPDFTIVTTFVDPVNNCLGLVSEGEQASMSTTLFVVPIQRFVPND